MNNHLYLVWTKVISLQSMLYLSVQHQYSLVHERGPPHKRDFFLMTAMTCHLLLK